MPGARRTKPASKQGDSASSQRSRGNHNTNGVSRGGSSPSRFISETLRPHPAGSGESAGALGGEPTSRSAILGRGYWGQSVRKARRAEGTASFQTRGNCTARERRRRLTDRMQIPRVPTKQGPQTGHGSHTLGSPVAGQACPLSRRPHPSLLSLTSWLALFT